MNIKKEYTHGVFGVYYFLNTIRARIYIQDNNMYIKFNIDDVNPHLYTVTLYYQ